METLSIINQLTSSSVKKLGEKITQSGLMFKKLPNSCWQQNESWQLYVCKSEFHLQNKQAILCNSTKDAM